MAESVSSKILSLVVARAGSKGLPNKNIKEIAGKPVFRHTIDYSLELSRTYDVHTVVSTDSTTIQDYCKRKNIDYIDRRKELADDKTRIEQVIYDSYKQLDNEYKYISLLYGDVTTRYIHEFIKAHDFLENNEDYDCVMSFRSSKVNPIFMYIMNDKVLEKNKTSHYRRQDINEYMVHNGHTILFKPQHFIEFMDKGREPEYLYEQFGDKIKPMISNELITSIDNVYDFKLAEAILKSKVIP